MPLQPPSHCAAAGSATNHCGSQTTPPEPAAAPQLPLSHNSHSSSCCQTRSHQHARNNSHQTSSNTSHHHRSSSCNHHDQLLPLRQPLLFAGNTHQTSSAAAATTTSCCCNDRSISVRLRHYIVRPAPCATTEAPTIWESQGAPPNLLFAATMPPPPLLHKIRLHVSSSQCGSHNQLRCSSCTRQNTNSTAASTYKDIYMIW